MFRFDRSTLARFAIIGGLLIHGAVAWAQPADPPGRVGRLADVQGRAWLCDRDENQWVEGLRNRALTSGDRLSTERGSRAEVRIGSTELRLGGDTELELDRIDDDRMVFRLAQGTIAVRVRSREIAREIEVRAAGIRVYPERAGHFRVDRDDDRTFVTAWRGSVRVDTGDQRVEISEGRGAEFQRDGRDSATLVSWSTPQGDEFADWVARDEQRDDRAASRQYVSPEMTGVEDLDRYGRWDRHPEYGMVWYPLQVVAGWAPYRHGRWTWSVVWGWTWVDDAPWGFAPFHYGRWVHWGGRWCWSPGAYVARPVFAPALVAWVGGPSVGVSISIGGYSGPAVGWVPLAPRDIYVPPFRYAPRYYERVNQPHRHYHPPQIPTGPIMYGNRGVPDAVTVVPADVLRQRQPVGGAVVRGDDVQRAIERDRFRPEMPVPPRGVTPRVQPVPGGAEPVRVPAPPGRDGQPPRVIDLRREGPMPQPQPRQQAPVQAPPVVQVPAVPVPPPPADRGARPDRGQRPERIERPAPAPERSERPVPAPERQERPMPAPERSERPAPAPERVPGAVQAPAPVVPPRVAPAPARAEPKAEPRVEPRDDNRGRDDRGPRTPESRQNQRDRQNQQ
jgi:FecR protein